MRADEHALAALDAQVRFPDRHLQRDVALLPLRGSQRVGAIHREGADGQVIAIQADDRAQHVLDELGGLGRNGRAAGLGAGDLAGHLHFVQVGQSLIHGVVVLLNHRLATLGIGFLDALLDLVDGVFARQDARDGKEAGLHDGVDAPAHAGGLGHLVGVDHEEAHFLIDDAFLGLARQVLPNFLGAIQAVEQEGSLWHGKPEHIEAFEEAKLVAGHKLRLADQVRGANGLWPEAQVRDGDAAGLL